MIMIKKNNIPLEDVLKTVAAENNLEYVPPKDRKEKYNYFHWPFQWQYNEIFVQEFF